MLLSPGTFGYILFFFLVSWTFGFNPLFRQHEQDQQRSIHRDRHSFRLGPETMMEENAQRLEIKARTPPRAKNETVTPVEAVEAMVTATPKEQEVPDKRFEHVVVDLYYPEHQRLEELEPVIDRKVVEVSLEIQFHLRLS